VTNVSLASVRNQEHFIGSQLGFCRTTYKSWTNSADDVTALISMNLFLDEMKEDFVHFKLNTIHRVLWKPS
jgi:hypothetical protein